MKADNQGSVLRLVCIPAAAASLCREHSTARLPARSHLGCLEKEGNDTSAAKMLLCASLGLLRNP